MTDTPAPTAPTYSEKCISLVKEFEGLRLTAYQDSVGVWTIGWGHTMWVRPGQAATPEQAEELLRQDLDQAYHALFSLTPVALNQNQRDALVSFIFNVGAHAYANSHLRWCIMNAQFRQAANEFLRWDHAGGRMLAGLLRRRKAEAELFRS